MSDDALVDVDTITEDRTADGFIRHRCICRHRTTLGAHGWENGQYAYKIIIRERSVTIYFGAFVVSCKDCKRRHRVRMLPKKGTAEMRVLRDNSANDLAD